MGVDPGPFVVGLRLVTLARRRPGVDGAGEVGEARGAGAASLGQLVGTQQPAGEDRAEERRHGPQDGSAAGRCAFGQADTCTPPLRAA